MNLLKLVFAAVLGAAMAIPGIRELGALEVPGGSEGMFQFVLASFSAAAVLAIYAARPTFKEMPGRRIAALATVGMLGVLISFLGFVFLLNKVLAVHRWGGKPATEFVPLFLPSEANQLIEAAGSRSQLLTEYGVDVLSPFITETSIGLTLIVLLLVYTVLVGLLAGVFAMLGIKGME